MERMVNEPVADSTLSVVKNIMTGSFARSLERPQTIANFAYNIEKYGLPKDYYETYLQKLNAITAADVQALAKKIIRPKNCYITVVGNKEIAEKLNVFAASGKVDMYNPDGSVFVDLKAAPAGVTSETVLNNYITAIGGKDKILAIKSYEQQGKYLMGPMGLDMNIKVKDNAKIAMTIQMNGMEMMKQVFDGTKGVSSQMGQKADMSEDELAEARQQLDMLFEINYPKYNITATLKGIGAVDGKDAYVIERKDANGDVTTEYYDVNSGLKVKSISVNKDGEEVVTVETTFLEYKEFNGVKFPVSQKQLMGAQEFSIQVSDIIINPKLDDAVFKTN
jgi:hypothetical protein